MRKTLFLSVFAALLLGSVANAQIAPLPVDPEVRQGKLENGLTYYIRHNEEPKDRAYFYIAQKVGSINEDDNQRGLAHFLEHMCFNGTVNFPEDGSLIKYCESIGVKFGYNLNAYTSTDETVYNIDAIPVTENNLDSCLLILHDWADGLLLEEKEIDKERGVIHEEWRMRSSASQRIFNRVLPQLYPGSKYAYRMPIGLMSVVDNFSPEFLRSYYETWYRPDLQGIVIVGDVDVDQMEAKVRKVFGPIQMPENPVPFEYFSVPSNEEPIYVIDKDKELTTPVAIMMMKNDPLPRDMRSTTMLFVQNYISSIFTSALNARLNELSQKADCPFVAASAGYGEYLMSSTMDAFEVDVVPKENMDKEAVEAVMKEVERARRFGFTGTEIYRMKDEFRSSVEKIYDNREKRQSSSFVNEYVRSFLDGSAIPGIEIEKKIYDQLEGQITVDHINNIFKQFTESITKDFVFLGMYPEKEGQVIPAVEDMRSAVEAARTAELEPYVDNVKDEPLVSVLPKAGKIKKVSEAPFGYTKLALANGANVYYKKTDFNNSEVIFGARSFGGSSLIDENDLVNAELLPEVISNSGLGNFNSVELGKALAGKQVSIKVGLRNYSETISGSATPKDLRTLFELIYLGFTSPADDPDAYQNIIQNYRTGLANAEKNPMTAFNDSIVKTIYGDNPRIVDIHLKDLEKADYSVIRKLYKERFSVAGDFDFYFTGNFDEDSLKLYVSQYIAPLQKMKKREQYRHLDVLPLPGVKMNRFTREMETPQAYIYQVMAGTTPYTLKESVAARALGNVLDNRYLKSIREDGGMAYSVSTSCNENFGVDDTYMLTTVVPFTPALCDSVLFLMDKGLEEVAAEGVTDEELDQFKKYCEKSYADSQRKNHYWQNLIINKTFWDKDEQTGYLDYVKGLTSDDVKAFLNDVILKNGNKATVVMLPADFTEAEEN